MKESGRYVKIVEWSDEDQSYVGQCPGIIGPCCHGPDEAEVYRELCEIVDEWIEIARQDGKPLPPPTASRTSAQRIARLAAECAKLDPEFEQSLAEEGLAADLERWPPYDDC